MRKIIENILEVLIITLTAVWFCSCECSFCHGSGECDYCSGYSRTARKGDKFYADALLGTWQMDYNRIGVYELKSIEFFDGHKCDVTYQKGNDPDWFTDTFTYTYTSGYIKLNNNNMSFSFKVRAFIFPELYLQDSRGTYTWRKVRSYGC